MNRRFFITAEELYSLGDEVVLIDCDLPPAYDRLHLPGAHLAACRYWKALGSDEGLHGIEDVACLTTLVRSWGIDSETLVVAYDNSGGLNAARLGWTLERFGFTHLQVLDGGLNSWLSQGHSLTQECPSSRESSIVFQGPTSQNRVALDEIQDEVERGVVLWDDRSYEEWNAGRIPGAAHLEWTKLLTDNGKLQCESALRQMLAEIGVQPEREICIYCQGGIRAAHSYWVLKHLGFERVTVFDGSWAEYSQSGLPVEV